MKRYVFALILIIVIVFLVARSDKGKVSYDSNMPVDTGGVSGSFARLQEDAIYTVDQQPGDEVLIKVANLSNPGFVILKKDFGGKPGDVIGVSRWLVAGEYIDISIGTTESLSDGLRYYASTYKDDGNGLFDPKSDKEVVTAEFLVDRKALDPHSVQVNF